MLTSIMLCKQTTASHLSPTNNATLRSAPRGLSGSGDQESHPITACVTEGSAPWGYSLLPTTHPHRDPSLWGLVSVYGPSS